MFQFISTAGFVFLFITCLAFILLTALPIFGQLVFIDDVNLRIWDFVLFGLPYLVTALAVFVCGLQRQYMLTYRLERVPRGSIVLQTDDAPRDVVDLVRTEYLRCSAIAYEALPTTGSQPGWGRPGTIYDGMNFKRAFLDAVEKIDATAREILPSLPRMPYPFQLCVHLRPLLGILPEAEKEAKEIDKFVRLVVYSENGQDEVVGERLRHSEAKSATEMTEEEYERAMVAVNGLQAILGKEKQYLESDYSSVSDQLSESRSMSHRRRSSVYGSERQRRMDFRYEVQEPYDDRLDSGFRFGRL
ncbi:SubName: Full=Uncharacterized protein {ECO:0000313/EMBL:CCA68214.1} [Serendipita indica DSM 11827]|nr:SubName: Full=Uncharacterized protein {ECO:0000313/EMBL:CCA68214.1} [Serendipita indica DSM 11827]